MAHRTWHDALDALAPQLLGSDDRTGTALVEQIQWLSHSYTRERGDLRRQERALAARLRFFLPRDLPKIHGPLSELHRAGKLPSSRTWRLLDLGSGLGTTALGVASYARQHDLADRIELLAVEWDRDALAVARELFERTHGELGDLCVPIDAKVQANDLSALTPYDLPGPFDLITLGLSLNELFNDGGTVRSRARFLERLRERLADDGSVVVIEPALREVSRTLQQTRTLLEERDLPVFSPCTHGGACPLLVRDRDWCHQESPEALPAPQAALAKAAGLRWERLTWAQLILRRDTERIDEGAYRIVGGPIASKGRTEWHACGPTGLHRLAHLDRHRQPDDAFSTLRRGDRITLDPLPAPDKQVRTDRSVVTVVDAERAEHG